jgi:hypothetical protein
MIQTAEQTSYVVDESSRRRSTFYVPLSNSTEDLQVIEKQEDVKKSTDHIYNTEISACSFEWSLNDSVDTTDLLMASEKRTQNDSNKLKRYGIVLNGSVNIDDSNLEVHANHRQKSKNMTSSTPIKLSKSKSRNSIDEQLPEPAVQPVVSPLKEKSKTLPVKETLTLNTFPPKASFLLKSTPKISASLNYSSLSDTTGNGEPRATSSPKKSLSFIRRTHSTKLSRSNSLLKSLTSKCVEQSNENSQINVYDLLLERLETYLKSDKCDELIRELFFKETLDSSTECCGTDNKHDKGKGDEDKENDDDVQSGK